MKETGLVVEGIRQRPDEDDEAFLTRAERVLEMEQEAIRARARMLVATAVKAFDKPDARPAGRDTLTTMVNASLPCYITTRSLLLARSLCRQQLASSTGSDPVAQAAYRLLSELALTALAAQKRDAMPSNADMQEVISKEMALLEPAVRANPDAVLSVLHEEFREFGASGRGWDRSTSLRNSPGPPARAWTWRTCERCPSPAASSL